MFKIGTKVIVRTYSAGVHFGTLTSLDGKVVTLANARRIWRWFGANTLNEIANHGVDAERSKISEPVPAILLTEAIEVIPCSEKSIASLEGAKWTS